MSRVLILLSSEVPPADRSTSLYDRYLRKPVTPDELLQLIRRLVASHASDNHEDVAHNALFSTSHASRFRHPD
jgi:DNA-binding response OmpR family regulator